ncbi:MAG: succinate dehydrogenase assembly factor 4 [Gammaproteobacteria bacterium]
MTNTDNKTDKTAQEPQENPADSGKDRPPEIGGPKGPEPTRYGDWEKKGRCIDF